MHTIEYLNSSLNYYYNLYYSTI